MNYEGDLNCALVCARKNENGLSLREVADRMGVSFPRISQIEHAAFKKLKAAGVFEEEQGFLDNPKLFNVDCFSIILRRKS